MKKFLFLGALAAMLLGTASCSNDMEPAMTDDGTVQFTIELPGNVDSRAISDGLNATELQAAVYKEDGTHLNLDQTVTMSNKTATVTFKLVKGMTYKFAFWAQKPGCAAYAFDASTGKVTVDYSKALANVDDGDAFSNTATLTVTGPMTETIYLYRPFAQLNYGDVMADYTAATAAGIDFSKTQVTVKQVATSFDIMSQTTSSENLVDVTWPAAASAIGENLNVENVDYKWLSMCYFLVPSDQANVETELSLLNTAGTAFNTIKVSNVPVQKNHRTNILGNLFTDDVNFNIIIDERFQQPDNNIVMLSDAASIAAAVAVPNAVVNIEPGTNVNLDLSTIAEGVTINGNGAKITPTNRVISADNITIDNAVLSNEGMGEVAFKITSPNITLKNIDFSGNPRPSGGSYGAAYNDGTGWKMGIQLQISGYEPEGKVVLENVNITQKNAFRGLYMISGSRKSVTVKNSNMDGVYTFNCGGFETELIFEDCKFTGWTSYDNGNGHTAKFTRCTFLAGPLQYPESERYRTLRPYQNTTFDNCTFALDGYYVQPYNSSRMDLNNCVYTDGNAVTLNLFQAGGSQEGNTVGTSIYLNGEEQTGWNNGAYE